MSANQTRIVRQYIRPATGTNMLLRDHESCVSSVDSSDPAQPRIAYTQGMLSRARVVVLRQGPVVSYDLVLPDDTSSP